MSNSNTVPSTIGSKRKMSLSPPFGSSLNIPSDEQLNSLVFQVLNHNLFHVNTLSSFGMVLSGVTPKTFTPPLKLHFMT